MTNPSTVGTSTHEFADKAAESADAAIRSARQKAHDALDGLSHTMQSVKDQANATLEKLRPQIDTKCQHLTRRVSSPRHPRHPACAVSANFLLRTTS